MDEIDSKAHRAIELWFFRDMSDDQRLKLFSLFGLPTDEIGKSHGRQRLALRHVLRGLTSKLAALEDENKTLRELIRSFVLNEIDYMTRNNLGDPEKQHNVKWARKLGITDTLDRATPPAPQPVGEVRAMPADGGLGEPKRDFNDTFSAAKVVMDHFFPAAPSPAAQEDGE